MRDPPADWFISNYFGWKIPDDAKAVGVTDSKWQQALDNTMNIGRALGLGSTAKS